MEIVVIVALILFFTALLVLGIIVLTFEFIWEAILDPLLAWYEQKRYEWKYGKVSETTRLFDAYTPNDEDYCAHCDRIKCCHCDDYDDYDDYCDYCGRRKYCCSCNTPYCEDEEYDADFDDKWK